MDFQQGIVERIGNAEVVARARRAADAARAHGIPVFFVRVGFRAGYPEAAAANASFGRLADRGDVMTIDHPATQIAAGLEVRSGEPIVLKKRISAFTGSDLDVLLRAAAADSLVLAGISTSGVVLSTLRQAADLDFRLTVLSDACADPDAELHRVLLGRLFPKQATVLTTAQWEASLAG